MTARRPGSRQAPPPRVPTGARATAAPHEIFLGRAVAICVHPLAAWRVDGRATRAMLVGGYFVIGFTTVLVALAAL